MNATELALNLVGWPVGCILRHINPSCLFNDESSLFIYTSNIYDLSMFVGNVIFKRAEYDNLFTHNYIVSILLFNTDNFIQYY